MALTRDEFASKVLAALKDCPGAVPYGSFVNGTFHYDEWSKRSHSDIDAIIPLATLARRRRAATRIRNRLRQETGLHLHVSVRNTRIHDHRIPNRVAPVVGFFEMLSKVKGSPSNDFLEYLMAKFLLRALAPDRFFGHASIGNRDVEMLVSHDEYARLMTIKQGGIAGPIAWKDLIERIADAVLRDAIVRFWTKTYCEKDLRALLPAYRGWFTGVEPVYYDLHRKIFDEDREIE